MGIQGRGRAGQGRASVVQRGGGFPRGLEEPVIGERDDVRVSSFGVPNSLVWNEIGLYRIMQSPCSRLEIELIHLPNRIQECWRI